MLTGEPESTLIQRISCLKSLRLSEIILQTASFDRSVRWYRTVLGLQPMLEARRTASPDSRMCLFRLFLDYPYSQILGVFEEPHLSASPANGPGLNHLQLRSESLDQLFTRYELLRGLGITPSRAANHGPGTSLYYEDPDGNKVELSAANFATEAEYLAFMTSPGYRANPAGIAIDPEEFVGRYRAGIPVDDLIRIPA